MWLFVDIQKSDAEEHVVGTTYLSVASVANPAC